MTHKVCSDDEFTTIHHKLQSFVETRCIPAETVFESQLNACNSHWDKIPEILDELKHDAKELGLWNLFLTHEYGPYSPSKLTLIQYAKLAEIMGKSFLASEACNCNAPDTGNMELLLQFGTTEQRKQWLEPLLSGEIRSTFLMTEPEVASSDARNVSTSIKRNGDEYVINGMKWWSTGAMRPDCRVAFILGRTISNDDPTTPQHTIVLVDMNTPGIEIVRPLTTFGYDDAPFGHAQVKLTNVRIPLTNIIVGEGRGFEVAQRRLGPGRIHHCMRAIGLGERALNDLCRRAWDRVAFNRKLVHHGMIQRYIADSRIDIEAARGLVLKAAQDIEEHGSKQARKAIAIAKAFVPSAIERVLDRCIQIHGAGGLSNDYFFARAFVGMRCLRIADGPDEVHLMSVARSEVKEVLMEAKL